MILLILFFVVLVNILIKFILKLSYAIGDLQMRILLLRHLINNALPYNSFFCINFTWVSIFLLKTFLGKLKFSHSTFFIQLKNRLNYWLFLLVLKHENVVGYIIGDFGFFLKI